jgi:hypothetical protein
MAAKCSVHNEPLLREQVPIRYGLLRLSPEFRKAQSGIFPNSRSFVLGGCRVSPDNPKQQDVEFCPKCREAEQRWNELHAGEFGKLPARVS